MTTRKTLFTPAEQWEKTATHHALLNRCYEDWQVVGDRVSSIGFFRGTHHSVQDDDVLIVSSTNGMMERLGMTGISSKGARLNNYHLPLRRGFDIVQLPDDFIGMQWNHPAIGRYVADLRASRRSRVSAYSPAPSHCKTSGGIDTDRIAFFGLYKSGRLPGSTRTLDYRHYLRFFPDGSVVATTDFNHQGWRISFDPDATSPPYADTKGDFRTDGELITFALSETMSWSKWIEVVYARYEGQFKNGKLWLRLTRYALSGKAVPDKLSNLMLPYRFHPFAPGAFLDC
jgi:hypothetical protein